MCLAGFVLNVAPIAHAETWYVRQDGGTRFSANAKDGQCDGKADAAYPGHGTNRHCAFKDYRYLWDDQHTYGKFPWVIAGGDTVILRNGPWRVGFDQGKSANDPWCSGGNGTFSCTNSTIPAGTAGHPTRILGENWASCGTHARMTEVFGGFGVWSALNLTGAQFVDVECLNITRHSDCVVHGDPIYPKDCQKNTSPIDDFDQDGISTDVQTHDLLLKNVWVHGHTDRGIKGPIGGKVWAEHVDISYNGEAGWDFDNGSGTPSVNATLYMSYSTVEWNGCNQEYPIRHENPAISCYGQSNGGYGDGIGTPANMGMDVSIDHSVFRYNTQDGEDFGHIDTGQHTLRITNSLSYGNGGGAFKWGPNFTNVVFENNLAVTNCMRMHAPIEGTPSSFNAHLADFCRAYDGVSFNFRQGGTALFANNTIVGYAPTTFDVNCWDDNCSRSTLTFENNLVLGYANPGTYNLGGKEGGPGGMYFGKPIGHVVSDHNLEFGLRNLHCSLHMPSGDLCGDPKFVNEPRFTKESDLDNFNFHLAPGSPARNAGKPIPGLDKDFEGKPRPASGPISIGALN